MLPIGDQDRLLRRTPYMTWALVVANTCVFAFQSRFAQDLGIDPVQAFGLIPDRLVSDVAAYWPTLFTHMFLHGSLLHIFGNMVFLIAFGRRLESELGPLGFLVLFLAGGVLAGLASVATRPDSSTPGIGASGAISAVMGAYLVLFPSTPIRVLVLHPLTLIWLFLDQSLLTFGVPALVVILAWFGLQVFEGLNALASPGGVDYAAHVGGVLAGYIIIRGLRLGFNLWPDEGPGHREKPAPPPTGANACVGIARPVPAGKPLTQADLQIQARRPDGVDANAIPTEAMSALLGRRLRTARYRYHPLHWEDLEPPETEGSGSMSSPDSEVTGRR